jgi:hypothetical protein
MEIIQLFRCKENLMNTKSPMNKGSNKFRKVLGWYISFILILILFCGFASYVTTLYVWDGGFPSGEFHIFVQNQAGQPITGAVFSIYRENSSAPSFGYPFDNYISQRSLISDSRGEIIVLHISQGREFGGGGWSLFWIIPRGGTSAPDFRCEISGDGYETLIFPVSQIFFPSGETISPLPTKVVEYDGTAYNMSVHEKIVVLKSK